MEPGAGRLPVQVLGENEALQQFFSGQDVSGVLDSSVAIDTSILEQYLSNDMDPGSFMLPESPPDSSSEACSPPQIPDFPSEQSYWCTQQSYGPEPSYRCKDRGPLPPHSHPLTHGQLWSLGLTNTYIKPRTRAPLLSPEHYPTPEGCSRGSPSSKKRRRSECEEPFSAVDGSCCETGTVAGVSSLGPAPSQMLSWEKYCPGQWSSLFDRSYQTLSPLAYHVDTDKGFNYSATDEAFVCQKKNHFQVTVHIGVTTEPSYVRTPSGPLEVSHFQIKVFGIKVVSLPGGRVTKVTLGRLHFSETTANNMRKKGKPNPDQRYTPQEWRRKGLRLRRLGLTVCLCRYFQMVVGLYAAVGEESFLLAALVSEKIIVRASNPGQFEMDGDALWQRGAGPEAVVCHGRVGINTDCPDEALVVCGNAKVMGSIMQPSDCRVKHNVQEADSEQQLKRITQMRIVEFDYKPEGHSSGGEGAAAVRGERGRRHNLLRWRDDTQLTHGGQGNPPPPDLHNEQIFMENVGAVQQLSKLTDNLDTRIKELEVWNRRLAKLKSLTGSLRSTGRPQRHSSVSTTSSPEPHKPREAEGGAGRPRYNRCVQNKFFQASFFTLLATMALCIICVTALYMVNIIGTDFDSFPDSSNNSLVPELTTPRTSTVPVTGSPGPWPPDVDFCELLYCDQVFCCPSEAPDSNSITNKLPPKFALTEMRKERFSHHLKSARDWKNTTVHTFMIKENQQVIDSRYCMRDECGPERYVFRVPISQFVPTNMRVTLLMNSTELLVVHLCNLDESTSCSSLLDADVVSASRYPSNTQGEHEWPLHVARLYHSSYHFRSAVAGQADCSTDRHFAGALFTDYHFYFYRRCSGS
ncbi:unnamed protein product [Menidia menidia]|uniref:(Atlantic silverside) hypothetical protein n=1 Tax=Menidia menidia TaxID=238744 RepID=A0A8S4B7N2_9TELE|nr:unnamed protein product [Menidia menidia]